MYLNNPKKLFDDLKKMPTMYDYMISCKEDGMQDDLENLISIVECNRDLLNDGDMNGSCRWDLSECETKEQREQMTKDHRKINWIWREIQRELKSKYVMECGNCKSAYFYQKKPKYDAKEYYCGNCKKDCLSLYTFEEWLVGENIYNNVKQYLKRG